ncbi:MAG: hypothetical protein BWY42_01547 [Candidatus Omnitrophica bacterium ADurb.Bin277]|nr:MAG: hypothetical protein BWY42_01547 [Candidatus Omnitrophica bacterium ADurb.Bin277]
MPIYYAVFLFPRQTCAGVTANLKKRGSLRMQFKAILSYFQ